MTAPDARRAVAIGGGTGLPQVLRCLVDLGFDTTGIVTMADDGGSSGVLRAELGILPPGDVRNCLVALASDEDSDLARVLQYRFAHGQGLAGHALGNLVLAALTEITGGFTEAIEVLERALHTRGRVMPSTVRDVRLHGVDRSGAEVFGQARLAANPQPVARVFLEPAAPEAFGPALDAIAAADAVVIGPGSLYTSIIPNFLVDGVTTALRECEGTRVFICNVANMRGETSGLDAADYVAALFDHGLAGAVDVVLAHAGACEPAVVCDDGTPVEPVLAGPAERRRIEALGVRVAVADLADPDDPVRHAREPLARALKEVLG